MTRLGSLDGAWSAEADDRGRLRFAGQHRWRLDWWVGADDRWHLPGREIAVRQRLLDDTPVVETAMRVPGGDVVHRAYGTRIGGAEAIVVEITNESSVPVALALVVDGARRVTQEETGARLDGDPGLLWEKAPSRAASGDVFDVVTSGAAGDGPVEARSRRGGAQAAFVWPLAHRTSLRFVVPAPGAAVVSGASVPSVEQVVRGWKVHGERGLRAVLPDTELQSQLDAGRLALLLEHTHAADAATAGALDRLGLPDEAGVVLRRLDGPELVHALAFHCRLHGDAALAAELADVVAAVAERAARRKRADLLADAAVVLRAAGEERAAEDAHRLASGADRPEPAVGTHPLSVLRDDLVVETADGLDLCRRFPSDWYGAGLEVHDAPTAHGAVSFAIRWHGDRPALLWEASGALTLRAPGLDPSWSSTEARGDALLGPIAVPGTPVAVRRR